MARKAGKVPPAASGAPAGPDSAIPGPIEALNAVPIDEAARRALIEGGFLEVVGEPAVAESGKKSETVAPAWAADRVERWPLDRLTPFANNARTHSPTQIRQIAESMRQWGWTMPCLADEAGMLLAGHARVAAARLLGYAEAPVMIAVGWSEAFTGRPAELIR